jgi:hypothetical protein
MNDNEDAYVTFSIKAERCNCRLGFSVSIIEWDSPSTAFVQQDNTFILSTCEAHRRSYD